MRRTMLRNFAFCILLLCRNACATTPFDGNWAGAFQRDGTWSMFLIHVSSSADIRSATIDLISKKAIGQSVDSVSADSNHIHFETGRERDRLIFDGALSGDTVTGELDSDGKKSVFRLDRTIHTDVSQFVGDYQFEPGHHISLTAIPIELGTIRILVAVDSQSGKSEFLFPRSPSAFFSGPCFQGAPAETIAEFITTPGQRPRMKWSSANYPTNEGVPIDFPEENLTFKNQNVTLAATLVMPTAPGPHPAIVFVHGSGPDSRKNPYYRTMANFFAANGVSSLIYDKRGVGKSTGNWMTAGFGDLADDALAGVTMLKGRADIESSNIGLSGMSQGGWLVSLAASQSSDIAFIISLSGAGVSPEEQGAFMVEHRARAEGFSDADVQDALALYHLNSHAAKTGDWREFDTALKVAHREPWFHTEYVPQDHNVEQQWRLIADYDPRPTLHKIHCPVLAIFGKLDPLVPAERSAEIWKNSLRLNNDATIQILPYANHGLSDPTLGGPRPEFFTLQRDWVVRHLQVKHQTP